MYDREQSDLNERHHASTVLPSCSASEIRRQSWHHAPCPPSRTPRPHPDLFIMNMLLAGSVCVCVCVCVGSAGSLGLGGSAVGSRQSRGVLQCSSHLGRQGGPTYLHKSLH